MCFSAGASFGAAVVLSTIGIVSVKKMREPAQLPFALIPLIFAVQQASEGFLWLSLTHPAWASFRWPMTYTFLFFAQIVWPFWVPWAIFKMENNSKRKPLEIIFVIVGGTVSAYLAYCLLFFPVEGMVSGRHIHYQQDYPHYLSRYGGVFYMLATIGPPFISGQKRMWSLGSAILLSYILTAIFYEQYIVSVWCFFASVISISVLAVIFVHEKTPARYVVDKLLLPLHKDD